MAKYKAYPEYKDSGVEWLGLVPKSWTVCRLKNLATIKNGQDYKSVQTDDGYPVMGSGGQFTFASKFMYDKPSVLLGRKGTIDKPLYINEPFWTVDTMYYTELNEGFDAKYVHYLALTIQFSRYSTNTALPSMTQEHLSNYKFSVPKAESERKKITEFLDLETKKIDNLIEKQQQLIELLKEKRQAVISHAVTKGLNPDVPMKDSGVEWLGDVPEHWRVSRIKNYAKIESGHTPSRTKPEYWVSCNIPWVSLNDSKQLKEVDYIEDTFYKISELGMANSSAHLLPARAVVFTRDASIGLSAITTKSMAVSQHLIAWICDEKFLIPEFLLLVFYAMEKEFERYTFGATIKTIGMDNVRGLKSTFPPVEEQRNLIDWAFNKIEKIKSSISRVEDMLSLLQERRTALISAAVTGKIDVRDWVAPEAQDVEESQEATA
ncbi:restriction endonuclease subunit S [Cronobacter malonaticus]|uniref:restriction endonuclease subunit S n=1 Tax=Cronobacter malonaticus TaxID=413503 RepID=UPI0005199495|nr:restriction endonuclease subunit S [Cronobacter malonaticus]EGT4371089.1 restriction endonuclease subunit S [Cronobacter malonaticus]ELY6228074.1 restriction endonuclease subunit S [Cronobacter malonaticus]MDI6466996.1 restriction endonuclease subunit S [Cronobacter malonaticus]HAU5446671.1 restriction endonuclease subunit S [Cronobacter malonaticus]